MRFPLKTVFACAAAFLAAPLFVKAETIALSSCPASADLATAMASSVDDRLVGKNPSTDKQVYSFYETSSTSPTFVRNPSVWTGAIDWTGASPWNSTSYGNRAGTLISPRHIVFANHYQIQPGAEVRFVAADNTVVSRTMTAAQSIAGTDITIGVLDSDVPNTIAHYPIMTLDEMRAYLSTSTVPVVAFDQEEHAIVHEIRAGLFAVETLMHQEPDTSPRSLFSEEIIGGDSGNPLFAVIGDQPVILLTHFTAGTGPSLAYHRSQVASAMTALGGSYAPAYVDLSCFDSFPYIANQTVHVPEAASAGHQIADVDALSFDQGQTVTYSISSGDSGGAFAIDPSTGIVTLSDAATLQGRDQSYFNLAVSATDSGPLQRSSSSHVVVYVDEAFTRTSLTLGAPSIAVLSDSGAQLPSDVGNARLSQSGRYVSFISSEPNIVAGVTSTTTVHVYLRDLVTGSVALVSKALDGTPQNASASTMSSPSDDGRYVAFRSTATNLVDNDANSGADVFIKDLQTGEVVLASVSADGLTQSSSVTPQIIAISGDGRYVFFKSSTALVPEDTNGVLNLYRKDILTGAIAPVDVTSSGSFVSTAISTFSQPFSSTDGNLVLFSHLASDLVADDTQPSIANYFVKNMTTGAISIVDRDENGVVGTGSDAQGAFSADGRYAAWATTAHLVSGDTDTTKDVYLRDTHASTTVRVSQTSRGFSLIEDPNGAVAVTTTLGGIATLPSGRVLVSFATTAKNTIASSTSATSDSQVFVKDMTTGMLAHASAARGGGADASAFNPFISSDGSRVLFRSNSSNLVAGDSNGHTDAFYLDVDASEPILEEVSADIPTGTYRQGQEIDLVAHFSEPITSTSTIALVLNTGAHVTLSRVSGSTITGTYRVESNESASPLNVQSISSSDVRASSDGHVLSLLSIPANISSTKSIVIATPAPVSSSRRGGGGGGGGGGGAKTTPVPSVSSALAPADIARLKAMSFDQILAFILQYLSGPATTSAMPASSSAYPPAPATQPTAVYQASAAAPDMQGQFGMGSRGEGVRELQRFLNMSGYVIAYIGTGSPGSESDYFGAKTQTALAKYQRERGLPATGYYGPLTKKAIFGQ